MNKTAEARLAWWREARFGLFIHWGSISLKGTEIGWSRGGERRGWKYKRNRPGPIDVETYDNLYKAFNPVKFNAEEWVQIAQDAGMKYLVFTSKHHDGFCMFDTPSTDYKITGPECPFGRDVVAELADACHNAGLRFGIYYSQPDWRHPWYRNEHHDKYIEYYHGHVEELLSNYGQVDVLWFDGLEKKYDGHEWDRDLEVDEVFPSEPIWDAKNLFQKIRALQPDILVNNRCGMRADFDTPEQVIGPYQTHRAWETCMTMGDQWAWKPNDRLKSLKECIQTLIRTAGGDGNLLFNTGPMPDGRIEPRQVERLKAMGDWLNQYGESIYGTRGGPFRPRFEIVSTHKGNRVFVHILDWPEETLQLPEIPYKIVSSKNLVGGSVTVEQRDSYTWISVPEADRHPIDTLIELELDRPVEL